MAKKIKVLQVISNFGIGGAEVWIIALLRYFKQHADELGVQIQTDVFLTNGVRDCFDGEAESLGARLIYAGFSRKTLPSFIAKWRRTLAEGNYDAIHDHQEFMAGWHFLLGAGYLPLVRIVHLHNPMSHQRSYGRGFLRRQTIKLGNRLIAVNATHLLSTSRRLITEQGFDDLTAARNLPKLAVHCGFDPRRFGGNRANARQEIRAEFKLQPDAKVMLFVGRLDSHTNEELNQKNPSFCLEVAKVCAALNPNFVCLIAGGGDAMLRILQKRVKEWGLGDRIRLLGSRSDIPRLMLGADLLLLPSLAEGLGMVGVEAQAAGLPVVASDAVPQECMAVDGMVEFLPLSTGPVHWADMVLKKLVAPKPDHRMANQYVMESPFSIENSARQLVKIYCGKLETPKQMVEPKQRMLSLDPAGLLWGSERALLDFIGEIPGFESACCCPPRSPLIAQLKTRKVGCFPSFQANLHLRGTGARVLALCGLLRALWTYRPSVLHVNQAGATRIALLACRIFRIPCVAHVRLQEDVEYLNRLRPSPKYLRHMIAISQPIADIIKLQPNLKDMPCAMLLDAYRPKSESGVCMVSNKRGPTKWDFVCVGRICDSKGQEILIRALQILQQGGISPKVVFVGEINATGRKLQNLLKELALESTVEFTGHRDDVFSIMDAAKWLVCPSCFEPLGRVLFEAWDAGIPVVVGKFSGGAAASVRASGGGLFFGEWTPVSLASVLAKALATDSHEAEQMAKKGRAWMAQAANPTRYAQSMSGIFRNAIHSFKMLA